MSVLQHHRKGRTEKPFAHSVMLRVQGSRWQSHSSRGRKKVETLVRVGEKSASNSLLNWSAESLS